MRAAHHYILLHFSMTPKSKWLIFASLGLVTIGAGASMVHWAGSLKDQRQPASKWVLAGTAALVVLNSGLSLFGRGVVEKMLHEVREKPGTG
jgi:ABC-type dipeptide/oligopeptide/nickel transport system permease subunit